MERDREVNRKEWMRRKETKKKRRKMREGRKRKRRGRKGRGERQKEQCFEGILWNRRLILNRCWHVR